jgi:glycosyltransferase involved in cell wall biosynthesis
MPMISIVTPCYNEAENIQICHSAVRKTLEDLEDSYDYEHIFIDNNSNDGTREEVLAIRKIDSRVKYFRNNRNVGSINNIWLGMSVAKGDLVIPLVPADIQDPPALIKQFIESWEKGYLVIQGIAIKRQESIIMRLLRRAFYFVIARLSTTYLPSGANEFCAIDRRVLDIVLQTNDQKPYVRGLIHLVGAKTNYIEYEKVARLRGKSKESLKTYFDITLNALVSTSVLFPRLLLTFGLLTSLISISTGFYVAVSSLLQSGFEGLFSAENLIWGVFLFLGLQTLFLGVIAEYIVSVHNQVRPKPKSFFSEIQS